MEKVTQIVLFLFSLSTIDNPMAIMLRDPFYRRASFTCIEAAFSTRNDNEWTMNLHFVSMNELYQIRWSKSLIKLIIKYFFVNKFAASKTETENKLSLGKKFEHSLFKQYFLKAKQMKRCYNSQHHQQLWLRQTHYNC